MMAAMLEGATSILDPMAGVGGIFKLHEYLPNAMIEGTEIEYEFASQHPCVFQGNALALPYEDDTFDAICVSPSYGNRMADHHNAKDGSRRNTYKHCLGHDLHPDNSGAMQWGDAYREFHVKAWTESKRVLRPGGRFLLNCKDHIRKGEHIRVTDWHLACLMDLGFEFVRWERVNTPGNRQGANGKLRINHENLILTRKGGY